VLWPGVMTKCDNAGMRSRWSVFYLLFFVANIGFVVWLNLPRPELPPQDASKLLGDPWFIWAFGYFGFVLMPAAALMAADAYRRVTRAGVLVFPYFALGVIPLSLYLALRPNIERNAEPPWLTRILNNRVMWWLFLALTVLITVIMLPMGTWTQLQDTMRHNVGWWFMAYDIPINHLAILPIVQADMRRRGWHSQTAWLALIGITGAIGLNLYLARAATSR
jgi:hypothetical protein